MDFRAIIIKILQWEFINKHEKDEKNNKFQKAIEHIKKEPNKNFKTKNQ